MEISLRERDCRQEKELPLCLVADSTALQRCDQCGYHISGLALGKVLLENAF